MVQPGFLFLCSVTQTISVFSTCEPPPTVLPSLLILKKKEGVSSWADASISAGGLVRLLSFHLLFAHDPVWAHEAHISPFSSRQPGDFWGAAGALLSLFCCSFWIKLQTGDADRNRLLGSADPASAVWFWWLGALWVWKFPLASFFLSNFQHYFVSFVLAQLCQSHKLMDTCFLLSVTGSFSM